MDLTIGQDPSFGYPSQLASYILYGHKNLYTRSYAICARVPAFSSEKYEVEELILKRRSCHGRIKVVVASRSGLAMPGGVETPTIYGP